MAVMSLRVFAPRRLAGILRESVVLGCAQSCQSQRATLGKLLNIKPILSSGAGS